MERHGIIALKLILEDFLSYYRILCGYKTPRSKDGKRIKRRKWTKLQVKIYKRNMEARSQCFWLCPRISWMRLEKCKNANHKKPVHEEGA